MLCTEKYLPLTHAPENVWNVSLSLKLLKNVISYLKLLKVLSICLITCGREGAGRGAGDVCGGGGLEATAEVEVLPGDSMQQRMLGEGHATSSSTS